MTTRPEFVRQAAWFPRRTFAHAKTAPETLAANGFLSELLSSADRQALRDVNVSLTRLAIDQCAADAGARNQIDLGTQICLALANFEAHGLSGQDLIDLSGRFDIVFPWSLLYGNVRTPFNARLIRLPLTIVFPRTVEEVVHWVSFVRDRGFSVSIRSGNNSYEGLSSANEIVIDLSFLTIKPETQFEIDAQNQLVHVAPGVRLGVLYTELANAGFALAGGQCAPVCIGGLVGTGGIGFASRRFGFVCDGLIEVEVVLADGRVVVANAGNEYADLYRACKGAGAAGLGVMTRLTMKIEPAVPLLWYAVVFDPEMTAAEGPAILAAWQELAKAPPVLSSAAAATASNDGSSIIVAFGEYRVEEGDACQAVETLKCLLHEHWLGTLSSKPLVLIEPFPLDESETLGQGTIEAATVAAVLAPMPIFNQWKLKSKFTFGPLTAAEWAVVCDFLRRRAPSNDPTTASGVVNSIVLGGASNSIDPESAVVPVREGATLWIHAGAIWNDESIGDQALAWVDELWSILDKIASPTAFYVCPDLQLGSQLTDPPKLDYVRAYWSSPTHDFVDLLIGVKNKYDADDVFRFAQSIPLSLSDPDAAAAVSE